MNQSSDWNAPVRRTGVAREPARRGAEPSSLADILERVLDKGIVIAGDIQINLLDIELLTIKIRLLVASVDRAKEMGIDWWEHDPTLSSGARDALEENERLRRRVGELEDGSGGRREEDHGAEREDER
ncbi:gas vesicle protein [Streptomyces sp. SID8382]|uniref:gas vesicle protein n=1 Tax=Streptomyces malaysiensis TaxID=92644 RepID=UPI000C2B81DD|nr:MULTISPECIES: gas vesicle protein [unclassified Streptomyces]AUA09597.1 Gas vesicle structural protein [Streptomyces sp. M56]MYX58965.1 gas vesicle protein [Streptomyces sp. SID8382]